MKISDLVGRLKKEDQNKEVVIAMRDEGEWLFMPIDRVDSGNSIGPVQIDCDYDKRD